MAPKTNTDEAQAKPEAPWVDVIAGSEVHREHEPTRLLRVSGLAPPGDLDMTSYWLGGLAYTAIALAAGVWLAVDWTMIDNEEPFDEFEAAERDWIAVQLPIPADPALDAQALHRAMRILSELAAMDMPDGLTVEGPRAPDGSGALVRARFALPREPHEREGESVPGEFIVCEAPVAAWQGLLGLIGQPGAIPLWGPESNERAIIAHMTHRLRERLRETGYGLGTPVTGVHEGSGHKRVRKLAWGIAATGAEAAPSSRRDVKRLLARLA